MQRFSVTYIFYPDDGHLEMKHEGYEEPFTDFTDYFSDENFTRVQCARDLLHMHYDKENQKFFCPCCKVEVARNVVYDRMVVDSYNQARELYELIEAHKEQQNDI